MKNNVSYFIHIPDNSNFEDNTYDCEVELRVGDIVSISSDVGKNRGKDYQPKLY